MTGKASNIACRVPGWVRQSRPSKVTWEICWPAPKQSKTVQPGKPWSRRPVWMPQRKSWRRFLQGLPAALFTAKSADLAKGRATQQSAKQFAQSAWRRGAREGRGEESWTPVHCRLRGS